jgi:hypothetical protein
MRFKIYQNEPKNGDIKTKTFFAWFPISIIDWDSKPIVEEIRWLETVTVEYKFREVSYSDYHYAKWEKVRFIENRIVKFVK